MRNLKKFLALVMAMVMAFSLMLTASAAEVKPSTNFSDDEGITEAFVEAVDVLAGMKVYKGDDTGTLRPGSTITRAEVAALIYRLSTGDVEDARAGLYANYGNFKDVKESDWYAGYVGYCANAGYIKGHGGYFSPYGNVTGYEALAMILRVIGYDKNHEFEGATWQTNVSALSTQLGILDDVKTTDYANTLHLASRRDVVASLLFNAVAYVPMVEYTPMAGYNKYEELVGNTLRPTVGEWQFGLTYGHGIIIGNQETGESNTKWGTTKSPSGAFIDDSQPVYVATNTQTVSLNMETGLAEFGHKFKVWYDHTTPGAKTVYTAYDKVVKTKLVTADDDAGMGDLSGKLGAMATHNGEFTLKYDVNNDPRAYISAAFRPFTSNAAGDGWVTTGDYTTNNQMYVLVSNTSGNRLDAVIVLNVQSGKVSQSDSVSATKTIQMPKNATQVDDPYFVDATPAAGIANGAISEAIDVPGISDTVDQIKIKQSALTAHSTITLGAKVVANAIGTEATADQPQQLTGYHVAEVTQTKVGRVVSYNTSNNTFATDDDYTKASWNPDYVMLSDGTKIEKSVLYYSVVYDTSATPVPALPQRGRNGNSATAPGQQDQYLSGTYRFYLDIEGRYIGAEPVYDDEFMYGTYIDYATALASASYEYTVVGVNMDGERVVRTMSSVDGINIPNVMSTAANATATGMPYRDQQGTVSSVGRGSYTGYGINSTGAAFTAVGRLSPSMTNDSTNQYFGNTAGTDDITIGSVDFALGAKETQSGNGVYLTESTKFIVVSGAGTDTQKVEVYNGLTELKGSASSVVISGGYDGTDGLGDSALGNTAAYKRNTMIYYSLSRTTYSQNNQPITQVDTVFLPKDAITWKGTSSLYFLGDNHPTLIDTATPGDLVKQYTMYVDGAARSVWLIQPGAAPTNAYVPQGNTFYYLTKTSRTAIDGQPVYAIDTVNTPGIVGYGAYTPQTNNSQTATITAVAALGTKTNHRAYSGWTTSNPGALLNVGGAKITSLSTSYPGIVDLATLNQAGALVSNTEPLRVAAAFKASSGNNARVAVLIYVCYDGDLLAPNP